MSDTLIEAGQSDTLIEEVYRGIIEAAVQAHAPHHLYTVRVSVTIIVDRLRAGGISDLTIRQCLCTPNRSFKEIRDDAKL